MTIHAFITTIVFIVVSSQTFAKTCYQVNNKDISVEWFAYKTPAKVPVKASLPSVTLTSEAKSTTMKKLIKQAKITIDASKVSSGNKARDKKIAKFFFGNMKNGQEIKASVVSMNAKKVGIKLMMNNKSLVVPMAYTMDGMMMKAKGHLDVLDLALSKSLSAINKACRALHEGKTWSDVALELSVKFTKC